MRNLMIYVREAFRYFYACFGVLLVACLVACSSTQKITVKQEQEGQVQETIIESDTKIRDFSMTITQDSIRYTGSWFRKPHRG